MDKVYVGLDLGSSTFQQNHQPRGRPYRESEVRDQRGKLARFCGRAVP